jgi:DNA-binding NarL/FixJ family response regulator
MTDANLSPLERKTIELMLAGKTCSDIARDQGVTHQAVHVRLFKARNKAGVRTLMQLGAWAERHGIRGAGAPG